ncbi:MAG: VWA domain-containing protein [Acidimicrobiales bacterium]
MTFSVEVFQNEFLAEDARNVHAIVKVTSTGGQGLAPTAEKAIVLVVDTSGSMDMPSSKIRSARHGAAAGIEMLPDGTRFALVAGTHEASVIYPRSGEGLAIASQATRAEAAAAALRLWAEGGTAISTWIDLARELLERHEGCIRLAYLLTDGRNEEGAPDVLDAALARAEEVFQCSARGVGDDWSVLELRKISSALLGDVGMIPEPERMKEDFVEFMDRAIGRTIADVRLRVWTPKVSTVDLICQVDPTIEDLTAKGMAVPPQSWDYPTGAWAGQESRQYHICIDVPPSAVGVQKKVADVGVVVGNDVVAREMVKAVWTDDVELSTKINRLVAHYTNQEELAEAVEHAQEARERGDEDEATKLYQRVADLAVEADRPDLLKLVEKVAEMELDGEGRPTVKNIRLDQAPGSGNALGVDSRRTTRIERPSDPEEPTG